MELRTSSDLLFLFYGVKGCHALQSFLLSLWEVMEPLFPS